MSADKHSAATDTCSSKQLRFFDDLQLKGLVQRRQGLDDWHKNVVELTAARRSAVRQAAEAVEQAEREFLGPLSAAETAQFKKILRVLLEDADRSDAAG